MTNRSGGQNFVTTRRPPDRNWMDTKRIRPTWMGNEARNTRDSGIEFTESRHDLLPIQPGGRKRHADDDTLLTTYADRPTNTRNLPWDGPHKRILFYYSSRRTQKVLYREVRHRKSDRDGPRMTCVQIQLDTEGHSTTETARDYCY